MPILKDRRPIIIQKGTVEGVDWNIFCQTDEPRNTEGVWIKTDEAEKVVIVTEATSGDFRKINNGKESTAMGQVLKLDEDRVVIFPSVRIYQGRLDRTVSIVNLKTKQVEERLEMINYESHLDYEGTAWVVSPFSSEEDGDVLIGFGGYVPIYSNPLTGDGDSFSAIFTLSLKTLRFNRVSGGKSPQEYNHMKAIVFDGAVYLFGGQESVRGEITSLNRDIYRLTEEDGEFELIYSGVDLDFVHSVHIKEDNIYIVGNTEDEDYIFKIIKYSPSENSTETIFSMTLDDPILPGRVALIEDNFYFLGFYDSDLETGYTRVYMVKEGEEEVVETKIQVPYVPLYTNHYVDQENKSIYMLGGTGYNSSGSFTTKEFYECSLNSPFEKNTVVLQLSEKNIDNPIGYEDEKTICTLPVQRALFQDDIGLFPVEVMVNIAGEG